MHLVLFGLVVDFLALLALDSLVEHQSLFLLQHVDFVLVSVTGYIHHKLSVAGGATSIIDDVAISAAHSYSRGNPRLIDNIMSYALDLGAQKQKTVLDADVMMASIDTQSLY